MGVLTDDLYHLQDDLARLRGELEHLTAHLADAAPDISLSELEARVRDMDIHLRNASSHIQDMETVEEYREFIAVESGAASSNGVMPLIMASPGAEVRLKSIRGGRRLRQRLADLGLNLGMTVRVMRVERHSPILLGVKDYRLALGRGMAHHIMVEPL